MQGAVLRDESGSYRYDHGSYAGHVLPGARNWVLLLKSFNFACNTFFFFFFPRHLRPLPHVPRRPVLHPLGPVLAAVGLAVSPAQHGQQAIRDARLVQVTMQQVSSIVVMPSTHEKYCREVQACPQI